MHAVMIALCERTVGFAEDSPHMNLSSSREDLVIGDDFPNASINGGVGLSQVWLAVYQ